jgi:hypothetical protein
MRVYDCWLDLTYPDGSSATMKPRQALTTLPPGAGSVTHKGNAVDFDASTYATVERNTFGPFGIAPDLQLTDFALVSTAGAPDTSPGGIVLSKLALANAAGPFTWKSKVSIRDLYNGVKGTFISPLNDWQSSDMPPYAQDPDHGYVSDANLAADGGDRRWLDIQLPFTISVSAAQRLGKIELLRRRFQGTGTFLFNLTAYQLTALDVISMNLPFLGWTGKLLEVAAHRFTVTKQGEATLLGTEIDVQETDSSIYDWDVSEELMQAGSPSRAPVLPSGQSVQTVAPPTGLMLLSDATTAIVGGDGIERSQIKVTWNAPTDGYVLNGGHTEMQYALATSPLGAWSGAAPVDPAVTQAFISGVTDGESYLVQVRFVNAAGAASNWTQAGPVTVSGADSVLPPSSISQGGASSGDVLVWDGTAWVPVTPAGVVGAPITVNGASTVTVNGAAVSYDDTILINGVNDVVDTG